MPNSPESIALDCDILSVVEKKDPNLAKQLEAAYGLETGKCKERGRSKSERIMLAMRVKTMLRDGNQDNFAQISALLASQIEADDTSIESKSLTEMSAEIRKLVDWKQIETDVVASGMRQGVELQARAKSILANAVDKIFTAQNVRAFLGSKPGQVLIDEMATEVVKRINL